MLCRFIAAAVIVVSATLPASALTLRNTDDSLIAAAERMKVKDFKGAREAASKSNDKAARPFLLGMSAVRLELWEEAANQLAAAAESYPLLADYALYNQGLALSKLGRHDQALAPLYRLLKQYPDSRLVRAGMILYADTMAAAGHPKEALDTYILFIERYPSGNDSISAAFGSALCREKLGDPKAAATALRAIWLNYPTSAYAEKSSAELQRLAAASTVVEPYSTAELFKRGSALYDLGRFKDAADTLAAISTSGQGEDFISRYQMKLGQAQVKAKRFRDAEATLRSAVQRAAGGPNAMEASYWLARALEKSGKADEAFELYLRVAETAKRPSVAEDALLEAAHFKRSQKKSSDGLQLIKRYLAAHPDAKNPTVLWEAAWTSYQSRDYAGAAGFFSKLSEREEMSEKALYWLGKSLTASGDSKGAETAYTALAAEYPFGYYTLLCNRWCEMASFPSAPKALTESLPMPSGFEREKALIALGLYDEAARELGARKGKNSLGIARLYLEMNNYNGAYHTVAKEKPKRAGTDSIWGVTYPLAFREDVARYAKANALPESLVYAIMRTESNYMPGALSPVGAVGLMQIMPATAETISKGDGARLANPELNIRLGSRHLRDLLSMYDKNLTLAIAAYNAGSGNVKKWQRGFGGLPQDEFVESIPFRETREYVKKVVTAMELYQRLYRLSAGKEQQEVAKRASTGPAQMAVTAVPELGPEDGSSPTL